MLPNSLKLSTISAWIQFRLCAPIMQQSDRIHQALPSTHKEALEGFSMICEGPVDDLSTQPSACAPNKEYFYGCLNILPLHLKLYSPYEAQTKNPRIPPRIADLFSNWWNPNYEGSCRVTLGSKNENPMKRCHDAFNEYVKGWQLSSETTPM